MPNSSADQLARYDINHVETSHRHAPYLLFILLVSVLSLVVLAVDMCVDPKSDTARILFYADTLLCVLFFCDFLLCFAKAKNKMKYMITWGWLDLVSSIPAVAVLRWGRAARLARVLRVLRGVRSARILMRFVLERRAQSAGLAAALASIVVLGVASILILEFERGADERANIKTPEDAIWWSVVTLTTVGYGDHYPVTTEGRIVAIALMVVGVAVIGTWAGIAASWFTAAAQEEHQDNIHTLRLEVQELKRMLEKRS